MEDLEMPAGSPLTDNGNEPEGNQDPRDPLRPEVEEEDSAKTPPIAAPYEDEEVQSDEDLPTLGAGQGADAEGNTIPGSGDEALVDDDASDLESDLDELDDKEFENFDASKLEIPLAVDESNVGLLGVHKRKRTAEEEAERERKKKRKEKKRDKPKRSRRRGDGEEEFEGGDEIDGQRARKSKLGPDGRPVKGSKRAKSPDLVDDETLSPEERRRRALERKMDEALKSHRVSRRKQNQTLEERADQEIEQMREKIAKACQLDAQARDEGQIATHKLTVLPQLTELLNRNTIQSQIVDPELNLLEAVRFMLEPASHDAALPNYKIQRDLFQILTKLNIGKEALMASEIGKVVLFYTKSTQPQPEIKRMAERLVGEWMRTVMNKRRDDQDKPRETRMYDPIAAAQSQRLHSSQNTAALAAEKRRKALAQPAPSNRARPEGTLGSYTVQPISNLSNAQGVSARKLGASGEDAFRKIAARSAMKTRR